jgi:hypothetical protein
VEEGGAVVEGGIGVVEAILVLLLFLAQLILVICNI